MKQRITQFLSALHATIFGTHAVRFVSEFPDQAAQNTLYLIGEATPWSAAMLCPCRCGAFIHLSLLKDDSPTWSLHLSFFGLPTLSPSVWRTSDCRSHFFLRSGRIVWCRSDLKLSRDSKCLMNCCASAIGQQEL